MQSALSNYLVTDKEAWDKRVAASDWGSFLQSWAWGRFREQSGWTVQRYAVGDDTSCQVLWRRSPLGHSGYIPRGPAADLASPACRELWGAVHEGARAQGATFLRVEPNASSGEALLAQGFRAVAPCLQPEATLSVSLEPDLDAVRARMKAKTRYNIGLAERRGVSVHAGATEDLQAFYTLLEETAKRDSFYIRPPDYYAEVLKAFGDDAALLLAEYEGQLLGGIVVVAFGSEATYLYGASSNEHRNLMPTYLLQWEGMVWAHKHDCRRYDLWGIPKEALAEEQPEEQTDGLWGVYRFKEGFGGKRSAYAGAFDYVYSPLRYRVWQRVVPLAQHFLGLRADFAR